MTMHIVHNTISYQVHYKAIAYIYDVRLCRCCICLIPHFRIAERLLSNREDQV